MGEYLVKDTSLIAIADAFRASRGIDGNITLEKMAELAKEKVDVEDLLLPTDIPDYAITEILEVVNKVRSIQTKDSITFIAMSDSHYPADEEGLSFYDEETIASTIQANMAAKVLAYMLNVDFFAHMGDVSWGGETTTVDELKRQIEGFNSYFKEASNNIPCFIAIGNHDAGDYLPDANALPGDYLFNNFTKHSESENTVIDGEEYGGYCYRDFADKKLRVFLLNTSESIVYNYTDNATLGSQRVWLANALIDLNSKADADNWSFVILCHYPADYGATMPMSNLLKAYVEGGTITISTEKSTTSTINFSGNNMAKFIAQFHGHVHNFKTDKLSIYSNGSAVKYDANRICIPNGQFNRENYYTTVGSYTDIDFSEDTSYNKTKGTANGTSFVINVINPSEEKIYSICYGAGTDRVIGYGGVTYHSITSYLTNVTSSNGITYTEDGSKYIATININDGYDLQKVYITMGGIDITSSVYADGVITIPQVTGNVVITIKATAHPNFTNLVSTSTDSSGNIYNNTGYKNSSYIASDGSVSTKSGYCATGFIEIPLAESRTVRIAGDDILFADGDEYARIGFYDGNYNNINYVFTRAKDPINWRTTVIEEENTEFTGLIEYANIKNKAKYIRVCAKGDGANLIVTVNEELSWGGQEITSYAIAKTLTNTTINNSNTTVPVGVSYSATLTPKSGYEISTVEITMGGIDITSSVYADGVITIPQVTGNVVITAISTIIGGGDYINQIQLSTTLHNGTEIFNSPYGYMTEHRLDSAGNIQDTDDTTDAAYMCCTGFIPVVAGDIVRIKNITFAPSGGYATPYILMFNSTPTVVDSIRVEAATNGGTSQKKHANVTVGDDDVITIQILDTFPDMAFMRLSVGKIDDTSILTVNQEI